jgi:alkanesulfonate monooxygenase SsuD/methylene tetrahydromethanopterin reductase-like flavin-dependent oxidoreductase (luciferase family)
MKIGLSLPTFTADVERPMVAARRAAELGYDAVFAPDHFFPPGSPDGTSLDPYALLAAIASTNPGLGVGVLVTRAGLRSPGLVAKQAAALDQLCGGRAVLGLGIGDAHARAEHERLGLPFPPPDERAAQLEDTASALRSLFRGVPWPGGAHVGPLTGPLLPPGSPEVWIGGRSERVLQVAARAGDAWNGWALDAEGFEARASTLARLAVEAGREPSEVPPTWGGIALVGADGADLARLEDVRASKGLPMDIWRGTLEDLRSFARRLEAAGCAWFVCIAAGPAERAALIREALDHG